MRFFIIAFTLITSLGTLSAQSQQPSGITVTGEGIIKVTPDRVKIKASVENKGQSADEVKSETDKAVNKILAFLKKEKIAEKDYQTDYINLNKSYDYDKKEDYYNAKQSITITLHDPDRYSDVMNGLMNSGANRIDGVYFEDSQQEKHQKQARIKAIEHAKEKAEDYAQTLNLKVGVAQMIEETNSDSPSPRPMLSSYAKSSDESTNQESPLAVGQIEIQQKITVRFAIELP